MQSPPDEFIIFDTEFTAWEGSHERGWSGEGEHREIIQIGAIRVKGLEEVDSFVVYVRPKINPKLSEYIINLTGVDQDTVDSKGVTYEEAEKAFVKWCEDLPIYSFRGSDQEVMIENDDINGLDRIDDTNYFGVTDIFEKEGIDTTDYISSTIPKAFGVTPPPDAHDALNDCRSMLLALQAFSKR